MGRDEKWRDGKCGYHVKYKMLITHVKRVYMSLKLREEFREYII